ncbi:MAG: DUF2878 domain-containing protein, partial [Gammaproteobacteria bacterium]|nr:DUF2878 domain-containing protein [Gammaproteobacteria bacterium]
PHAGVAPLWILMLWAGFSLTLNHSLAWLQKHYFLAALFAAIASPLSYLAGEKLGAVTFTADIAVTATAVSVAWAAALPALLFLAKRWLNQQPGSRDLWALSR